MNESLSLDIDGDLWLLTEGESCEVSKLLGSIDDPQTSYKVPAALLDQLGVLEREWVEMGEFALDCRATAEYAYRLGKGIV